MNKKQKEFDIERSEYDDKVEEIRKKKRKLRDIQEPSLVKKIKKDLEGKNIQDTEIRQKMSEFLETAKKET